jgi:hypothetical protein
MSPDDIPDSKLIVVAVCPIAMIPGQLREMLFKIAPA